MHSSQRLPARCHRCLQEVIHHRSWACMPSLQAQAAQAELQWSHAATTLAAAQLTGFNVVTNCSETRACSFLLSVRLHVQQDCFTG